MHTRKNSRKNANAKRSVHKAGQLLAIYARAIKARTTGRDALRPVATLIVKNAPEWLSDFLFDWQSTLRLSRGVEATQPTRTEMKAALSSVETAAATLSQELSRAPVQEFLNLASASPMPVLAQLQHLLVDVQERAKRASHSPVLVDEAGKTRAGRGPAMPKEAISPQVFCALLVAECYQYLNGKYPAPRNMRVALAADLYWQLSVGKKPSWGNDPLTAWRRHFQTAISPAIAQFPEASTQLPQIRRHLQLRERDSMEASTSHDP